MEEKLLSFPLNSRKFLTIGYILRIIPVANIVGSALIPIGWYKIGKWGRNAAYNLALIGSIVVLIMLVYSSFFGGAGIFPGSQNFSQPQMTGTEPISEIKDKLVAFARETSKLLKSPEQYVPPIIVGLGIILESLGVKRLSKDTDKTVPGYLFILMLVVAVLAVLEAPASIISAQNLEKLIPQIQSAETMDELTSILTIGLITAMAPIIITGLLLFIIGLITYIMLGYKIWKIEEHVKRIKLLSEAEKEEEGPSEELLI